MYTPVFIVSFCIISTFAGVVHLPTYEDEEYILVPISRVRRQTTGGVDSNGRAFVSHTGTLVDNNRHNLQGTASASKQFKPNGPLTVGGALDYTHKPSGSTLGVGASNTRGFGTDVGATGKYNFYNKGGTSVFAEGNYGRHFGGPGGTGRPNYYGGFGISHRW
ncbi:attacin c-terminal region [Holotrichia oblita]|uniref:Attacin c-terminal region n=2 Tax=Holotrichia oblita TaxID=644536 RepID=A0ACB9T8A3_HOLOL|nr:attacin c-terminal region [Holotrichia oblita]KAI4463077.1 attacin c-terminal region [Holotrichia oblita]